MFDAIFPKHWTTLQRLMWLKTNALARAVYETISGNPVSFSARSAPLRQLKVAFSPVQSLNGYDAPWPAGGGKNKCDGVAYSCEISYNIARVLSTTPISSPFVTTSNYAGAGFIAPVKAGQAYALSSDVSGSNIFYWAIYANLDDITDRAKVLQSGSTSVTFTADYDGYVVFMRENHPTGQTVTWTYAQLELGSSATSYAPYSNECPISGWSSLTVEQRGKNLLNPVAKTNGFYAPSVGSALPALTADYSSFGDNTLTVSASAWVGNGFVSERVFEGKTYKVTGTLTATTPRCSIVTLDEEYKVVRNIRNIIASGEWNESITVAIGEMYIGFSLVNAADSPITLSNPSISESGEYQPYNGRSISISLGQTVYSGWVDVMTGQGEITWVFVSFSTLGEKTSWNKLSSGSGAFYMSRSIAFDPTIMYPLSDERIYPFSTKYRFSRSGTQPDASFRVSDALYIVDDRFDNIADFRVALVNEGGGICYALATPIPIQLTPEQVNSLAGDNTMWTDADSLEVTYRSN